MAAKVLALQVDHVVSPTTPREGLMIKPIGVLGGRLNYA